MDSTAPSTRAGSSFWLIVAAFALSALPALWGRPVRAPAEMDAGGGRGFSAERAAVALEWIAAEPHPVGSPAGERVAARLADELRRSGFEVQLLRPGPGEAPINVYARRPGTSAAPSVLFAAHHDSTPAGPGAGDDGIAIAALLELARVFAAAGPRERGLALLLTDGEEAGKLGARLFLQRPDALEGLGPVINVEAVGNRGPTVVFQAGPANADLLEAYARATGRPHASSLAEFLFELLPNDTDFTEFRRAGARGLNLAVVGGSSAYHAPFDTPEHLHAGSLQRLGETLVGLARELQATPVERAAEPVGRQVFHAPAELWLVRLPLTAARPLALGLTLLCAGLLARLPGRRPTGRALGLAALAAPLTAFAGAQLQLLLGWTAEPLGAALLGHSPRGDFASAALTAAGVLVAGAAAARVLAVRLGPDAVRELVCAGLALWCALVAGLALLHPGAAWVLSMPLVPAALALRLGAGGSRWTAVVLAALPAGWLGLTWVDLNLLTSLRPTVCAAVAWGTLALGLPLVGAPLARPGARQSPLDLLALPLGLALIAVASALRGAGF